MSSAGLLKYWALFKISFKDRMSSPAELIVRTIFFGAIIFIFSQLWGSLGADGALSANSNGGNGAAPDLVWYLFITEAIVLSLPPLTEQVDQEIQTGSIAYQLVRPLNYVATRSMSYLGDVSARFCVNAVVGFFTAAAIVGWPSHALNPLAILILVFGAFLIHLGLSLTISMLGFWVEDTLPFFWIYSKAAFILGGLFMPLDYYPEWLRELCRKLPFQDSVYSVAHEALSMTSTHFWLLLTRQLGWAVLGIGMASLLYRVGVERLEARGG